MKITKISVGVEVKTNDIFLTHSEITNIIFSYFQNLKNGQNFISSRFINEAMLDINIKPENIICEKDEKLVLNSVKYV